MQEKILILRFSSFGDIVQCLSVPAVLKKQFPNSEIHWLTREDFKGLIEFHPALSQVHTIHRKDSFWSLIKMAKKLSSVPWTHIYDAHHSQRSTIIVFFIRLFSFFNGNKKAKIITRSIRRWKRFLLFNFRINQFQQPFSGQRDLIEPLKDWGVPPLQLPETPQFFFAKSDLEKTDSLLKKYELSKHKYIVLAPSAAFPLKRWPKEHFIALIHLLMERFDQKHILTQIVLLGGPEDSFIEDLRSSFPMPAQKRIINLAGKLSLVESSIIVEKSLALVANDTGLLHVGEQLGKKTIALMGPAPFGFPSRTSTTIILEKNLTCRPCSKHGQGPCTNSEYQACLVKISPDEVLQALDQLGVLC